MWTMMCGYEWVGLNIIILDSSGNLVMGISVIHHTTENAVFLGITWFTSYDLVYYNMTKLSRNSYVTD